MRSALMVCMRCEYLPDGPLRCLHPSGAGVPGVRCPMNKFDPRRDSAVPAIGTPRWFVRGVTGLARAVMNRDRAPDDVVRERRRICSECKAAGDRVYWKCGLCGCSLRAKTRVASERCPADPPRWEAVKCVDSNI